MIISSHSQSPPSPKLLNNIRTKLGLSEQALALGIKQAEAEQAALPIILWSFGLITLDQYQEVLNWQDNQS